MAHVRLLWVDIGMAVAAALYLGMVVFLRDNEFIGLPLMLWFMSALVVWAVAAEVAAVRAEKTEQTILWAPPAEAEPGPYERLPR